jgi:hypothetical protein
MFPAVPPHVVAEVMYRASKTSDRYGCHNRPPLGQAREVQDGHRRVAMATMGGGCEGVNIPRLKTVPHRMTSECQYVPPAGRIDPKCDGCNWRKT